MHNLNALLLILYIVISIAIVYPLQQKNRWKGLLATSLIFLYILIDLKIFVLLFLSSLVYGFSLLQKFKSYKVWWGILILLIPLVCAKWFASSSHFEKSFINANSLGIDNFFNWKYIFQVLGLSYFTFNAISYLVDIDRKYISPQKNYFKLLLYLLYFPTIFSGPLHRAKYLFKQFENISISRQNLTWGCRLILFGLFKNLVVAQRLQYSLWETVTSDISGIYSLLSGLLFSLYLYCNFSSFIDIFQGVSLIFNIDLKSNFRNRIYISSSRQEYWKGWHITLNEWFRDYFFFVIIKYDRKRKFTDLILFITFVLIAIWHEFSAVVFIWGCLNGLWIVIEKKFDFSEWRWPKLRKTLGVFYHFFFVALIALVFISPNIETLIDQLFWTEAHFPVDLIADQSGNFVVLLATFIVMDIIYIKSKKLRFDKFLDSKPSLYRYAIYFSLTLLILVFGTQSGIENYYIQF